METMEVLGYVGAMLIGIVLGLMGSGGSLLTVPIFTYFFHIGPVTTTAYSLFVVGSSASVGVLRNFKKNVVDFKMALFFAVPSLGSVFIARKYLVAMIPEELFSIGNFHMTKNMGIMIFFAFLALSASLCMIFKKKEDAETVHDGNCSYLFLSVVGAIIGLLTGIVGIGGGFIIIPVLVLFLKLPIKKAVATSLLIISLKSLAGFLGDLGNHIFIDWIFLLGFTSVAIMGMLLGIYLSSFVNAKKLKKWFGGFVFVMSIFILYMELAGIKP